jgi:hypothetical protein
VTDRHDKQGQVSDSCRHVDGLCLCSAISSASCDPLSAAAVVASKHCMCDVVGNFCTSALSLF